MDERLAPPSITVYPDGPLVVRGAVEIRDLDGTVMKTGRTVALCRCGRSAAKPMCDGGHARGRTWEAPPIDDDDASATPPPAEPAL